jgi:Transposase Tn5 dimerisation domain/Transposase DNA-binding
MQEWIGVETASANFGDERLDKRYRIVLNTMTQKPSLKFPAACDGRAEAEGGYRFLDNDKVDDHKVLVPHHDATMIRIRQEPVVLIPQDTTELDLTRPHEYMAGAGPLNDASRVGFFDHVLLAETPEGVPLGVVHATIWARDAVDFQKDAKQKRDERRAKSIEQKESYRWLEGYRISCQVAREAPDTQIVSISDSEGDVFECLVEGQPEQGVIKAEWIIRACQDRAVLGQDEGNRKIKAKLVETVASTPVLKQITIEVRQREAKSKDGRKRRQARQARTAEMTVQAARVKVRAPDRKGAKLDDVYVNVVLVRELNPPVGEEPIEWVLVTSLPIDTTDEVLLVVQYYCQRWTIEIFFKILKSGCKVEESQLETAERFRPYLGFSMIAAWRIQYVMKLGRDCPDLPCDIAFDEDEWQAAYAMVKKEPPPSKPPTLREMIRLVGSLGGHMGRKGDGEPGPKAMWVGMQRLTDIAEGWRAAKEHGPFGRGSQRKASTQAGTEGGKQERKSGRRETLKSCA